MKHDTSTSPRVPQSLGEKCPASEPRVSFLSLYLLAMISAVMLTFAPGLAAGLALGTLILKTGTPKATASSSGSEMAIVAYATRHVPSNPFDFSKIAPLDETTDAHGKGVCPVVAIPALPSIAMPGPEYHGLTAALPVREVCRDSGRYGRAPPRVPTWTDSSISCHSTAPSIALPKPALCLSERPSVKLRDAVPQAASNGAIRVRSSGPCSSAPTAIISASNPLRI